MSDAQLRGCAGKREEELLKETYEFEIPWRWIPGVQDPGMIMNPPVIPEDEDCSSDIVPVEFTDDSGRKRVYVSELISVTSVFFKRYRLALYTYLNRCLRNGTLAHFVGSRIMNGRIDHTACSFPKVSYWRIDRENFYADVEVELNLNTQAGEKRWKGYLVCWCCFEGAGSSDNRQPGFEAGTPDLVPGRKTVSGLSVTVEELTDQVCRDRSEYDPLNHHLVPYAPNRRVDRIAEQIWEEYLPEALTDPGKRRPEYLAKKMGLSIMYCPVHEHRGVKGIVFFKEDDLYVGEDRVEKTEFGKKRRRKVAVGKPVRIPANTIVINTNKVNREYPAFDIYHECYHYYEHYLFYCLQELASNDFRRVPVKEVVADKEEVVKDSVYFMEKQADRGAMGLMMPVTEFQRMVKEELSKVKDFRHAGDRYDIAGIAIGKRLGYPHFRIRARMIQLGYIEAKGALNYIDGGKIEPFAFNAEAWRESDITFNIREAAASGLMERNEDFRLLMEGGKYVFADGHVVRNTARYVCLDQEKGKRFLTAYANAHVDRCCLRFVQKYIQHGPGRYVYGRLYVDSDYLKQNDFYLNDIINEQQIDELDAMDVFADAFPKDFKSAVDQLKKKNRLSNAKLAEIWNMDDSTFARILDDPKMYRNEDFLTLLCLCFKTPDWISRLLFKRARFQLDDEDRRQRAIQHILRVQSNDGIEAANTYLTSHGLEPLRFVS